MDGERHVELFEKRPKRLPARVGAGYARGWGSAASSRLGSLDPARLVPPPPWSRPDQPAARRRRQGAARDPPHRTAQASRCRRDRGAICTSVSFRPAKPSPSVGNNTARATPARSMSSEPDSRIEAPARKVPTPRAEPEPGASVPHRRAVASDSVRRASSSGRGS